MTSENEVEMTRRFFLGAGVATASTCLAGGTALRTTPAGRPSFRSTGGFVEPAREIPLDTDADVIVVGGGPAGIAAAVAAARAGRNVRLFELQGCLGGVWTAGLLTYIFQFDTSATDREIIRRLDAVGGRRVDRPGEAGMRFYRHGVNRDFVYDPECMKIVCEDLCADAGVKFTLQSPVVAAYRDATGRNIETIVTESKSGRRAWRAKTFIDCSGDGDLAALAGCGFDLGYTPEGWGQPATLNALVIVDDGDALEAGDYVSNGPALWTQVARADGKGTVCRHIYTSHRLRDEMHRAGVDPSYGDPTLFRISRNLFCFMVNHEYKLRIDDAAAISAATVRARKEIFKLASALANLGGPWKGLRVVATAEQIGHRDARRIHGRYTVTRADVAAGATFPDAVATSRFGIDIHGLDKKMNEEKAAGQDFGAKFRPFQIPLRACRARDADNLYMAGRCISGDFIAHASYRVTGTAVAMGEAVGRAAAVTS